MAILVRGEAAVALHGLAVARPDRDARARLVARAQAEAGDAEGQLGIDQRLHPRGCTVEVSRLALGQRQRAVDVVGAERDVELPAALERCRACDLAPARTRPARPASRRTPRRPTATPRSGHRIALGKHRERTFERGARGPEVTAQTVKVPLGEVLVRTPALVLAGQRRHAIQDLFDAGQIARGGVDHELRDDAAREHLPRRRLHCEHFGLAAETLGGFEVALLHAHGLAQVHRVDLLLRVLVEQRGPAPAPSACRRSTSTVPSA